MRGLIVALLVLISVSVATPALSAQVVDRNVSATASDQVRALLDEGVRLYRVGRYDEAALRMKDAMLLEPQSRLVYEFYLAMGDVLLMRMLERAELEPVMKDILRQARVYQKELRNDPRFINLLIQKLRASEKERLAATTELVAIGPIAVPHLVAKIGDNRQDEFRVWNRMVLTRMGYRAVIPLIEALNGSDARMVSTVATILADIGDSRALPKLSELMGAADSDDTLKTVCRNAVAAIAARSGMSSLPASGVLYYQEAMRYFKGGDQVQDEMVANESLFWRWDESAEPQLTYTVTPPYAWNELIAEELLYDGMASYGEYDAFYPVLASVHAAQDVEANMRLRIAADMVDPANKPWQSVDAIQTRVDALAEMVDRVKLAGPTHLYRAFQQSVVSERYEVAVYLLEILRDGYTAHPEILLPSKEEGLDPSVPGTVLAAALDHPERRIRYAAATTLAHLDPKLGFFNSEKVIPLLAEAVGEWGMLAVLVVDQDFRHRNMAREALNRQGVLVYTAGDGFQARSRIAESPVKDAIIIAGDLVPALRDEFGVVIDVDEQTAVGMVKVLRADPRTEATPIFISLPEDPALANEIQTAFEGSVDGFVQKPYNGTEMKGKVETAIGDSDLPVVNREQRERVSLAACEALGAIDEVRSQFAVGDAANALVEQIRNRDDEIRIAALTALGHTGATGLINQVTEVYDSQASVLVGKPEVRAAFMYAIGQLDPTTSAAKSILLGGLQAEELVVRRAAAEAVSHGEAITNQDRYEYLLQQRLDVLGAGSGQ